MARLAWVLAALFMCGAAVNAAEETAEKGAADKQPQPRTVAMLRARGPEGLAEGLRIYDGLVENRDRLKFSCADVPPDQVARLKHDVEAWQAAIDQIGAQRTCAVSRLYWYTDFAEAKAAATRTGRPILSLRMLGKLTDEYSCANSRFFRTAIYSNKEISQYLRDNFILHWQSMRPAPRVTIDFGDGRKLERTITGNSAHYALSNTGEPLDVLPGLYSPQQFLSWLRTMRGIEESYRHAVQSEPPPAPVIAAMLKQFHLARRDAILREWDADLERLGEKRASLVSSRVKYAIEAARLAGQPVPNNSAPKAKAAALRAVTKSAVERPLLRFANFGGQWLEKGMDDDLWQAIANLHRADVRLDESSKDVMRHEFPQATVATRLASGNQRVEDPVLTMISKFEDSIGLDTVRNEYLLHRRVHELLAESASGTMDLETLNEWVYAELFLTPSKDPWLGLAAPDVYTALDKDGRVQRATQVSGGGG